MIVGFALIALAGYPGCNGKSGVSTAGPGPSWYVDRDASGSNSGASWADAWKSFAAIRWGSGGVSPGDTIYISGGTASKTYNETLIVGGGGAKGRPVTIKAGQDPGHNGIVIIDGQFTSSRAILNEGNSHIVVDGEYNGTRHLDIRNHNEQFIRMVGVSGCSVRYVSLHESAPTACSYGILMSGANNEVAYSHIYNLSNMAIVFGQDLSMPFTGYGSAGSIHHNYTTNITNDHIQMNEGVDVYNNVFDQYRDSSVITGCAGEYTDIIHTSSGTHRIYNNKFIIRRVENGGNGMIFIEVFGAIGGGTYPSHRSNIRIYNNEFFHTDPNYSGDRNVQGVILKWYDSTPDAYGYTNIWDNVSICNNTFVDHPYVPLLTNNFPDGMRPRRWEIKNNVFVNSQTRGGSGGSAIYMENGNYTASDVVIDGNVFAAGAAGGTAISFLGTRYATPGAYNSAYGRDNRGCMPSFVSYTPGVYSGRNLGLQTSDVCAADRGFTLGLFDTDMDGVARPQGSAWDIGAHEAIPLPSSLPSKVPLP
jgi:hypothetical protein